MADRHTNSNSQSNSSSTVELTPESFDQIFNQPNVNTDYPSEFYTDKVKALLNYFNNTEAINKIKFNKELLLKIFQLLRNYKENNKSIHTDDTSELIIEVLKKIASIPATWRAFQEFERSRNSSPPLIEYPNCSALDGSLLADVSATYQKSSYKIINWEYYAANNEGLQKLYIPKLAKQKLNSNAVLRYSYISPIYSLNLIDKRRGLSKTPEDDVFLGLARVHKDNKDFCSKIAPKVMQSNLKPAAKFEIAKEIPQAALQVINARSLWGRIKSFFGKAYYPSENEIVTLAQMHANNLAVIKNALSKLTDDEARKQAVVYSHLTEEQLNELIKGDNSLSRIFPAKIAPKQPATKIQAANIDVSDSSDILLVDCTIEAVKNLCSKPTLNNEEQATLTQELDKICVLLDSKNNDIKHKITHFICEVYDKLPFSHKIKVAAKNIHFAWAYLLDTLAVHHASTYQGQGKEVTISTQQLKGNIQAMIAHELATNGKPLNSANQNPTIKLVGKHYKLIHDKTELLTNKELLSVLRKLAEDKDSSDEEKNKLHAIFEQLGFSSHAIIAQRLNHDNMPQLPLMPQSDEDEDISDMSIDHCAGSSPHPTPRSMNSELSVDETLADQSHAAMLLADKQSQLVQ